MRWGVLLLVIGLAAAPAGAGTAPAGWATVDSVKVGGDGGWDLLAVDGATHRLFVARSTRLQVVDLRGGGLLAEIPDTPGIHGVALAPDLGKGFTSNGRDSSVTVFDLASLAVTARVHVDGRSPDAILYDEGTRRVFTMNAGSGTATAIDARTDAALGNVELGGRPELAVSDGAGRIFVNLEDSSAVVSFDARSLAVGPRWSLAPGEEPTGLAIDRAHGRLFAACANGKMIVLDARDGGRVAELPIGPHPDGAGFDPGTGCAFASSGAGTMTVVHEDTPARFTVVADVPTRPGARTMTVDPVSHRAYTVTAGFGPRPEPTPEQPRPRPGIVPGTFEVLVVGR